MERYKEEAEAAVADIEGIDWNSSPSLLQMRAFNKYLQTYSQDAELGNEALDYIEELLTDLQPRALLAYRMTLEDLNVDEDRINENVGIVESNYESLFDDINTARDKLARGQSRQSSAPITLEVAETDGPDGNSALAQLAQLRINTPEIS